MIITNDSEKRRALLRFSNPTLRGRIGSRKTALRDHSQRHAGSSNVRSNKSTKHRRYGAKMTLQTQNRVIDFVIIVIFDFDTW